MREEITPKPKGVFWNILFIVLGGFFLLSLPEFVPALFDFPGVKAVYDFLTLLALCFLVFRFIRRYSIDYKYRLEGSVLTVSSKLGAKETVFAQVDMTKNAVLMPLSQGASLISEQKWNVKKISVGVTDFKKAYLLTYPIQNGKNALVFQPSDEFVKILQQFTA